MRLPGFSAEMALGKPSQHYRTPYSSVARQSQTAAQLTPSQFAEDLDVGELEDALDALGGEQEEATGEDGLGFSSEALDENGTEADEGE